MNITTKRWQWAGLVFAVVLGSTSAMAGTPVFDLTPLSADFNDKTPGQPLGTGGAASGEPVSLGFLDTLVVEAVPGENFLQLSNPLTSTSARSLRWLFEDNREVGEGLISISLDFTPSARDRYSFAVRERDSGSRSFLDLNFNADGRLYANDAAGLIGEYFDVYNGGDAIHIDMLFDMDARTSSLTINGNPMYTARSHGISDLGVGSFFTGYASNSSGSPFAVDNLLVLATVPLPLVFDADFNSLAPGQPIGTGGAAMQEPVFIPAEIAQQAISIGTGDVALQLLNTTTTASPLTRWKFLEELQIRTGIVAVEMDVRLQEYDVYLIRLLGPSGTTSLFGSVYFFPDSGSTTNGSISVGDASGYVFAGTYQKNVFYRLRMFFDMDEGTYTVLLNDTLLVEDRPQNVSGDVGIGALEIGFPGGGVFGGPMVIDNLQVGSSDAPIIPAQIVFFQWPIDGSVNEPLTPAMEVAVGNAFGDLVPDGTLVSLVIDSGPAGAVLSGAIEPMVVGVARFASLSVDLPGTYRLRAIAGDAEELGYVDIVVTDPAERIFDDGFDGAPLMAD